MKKRMIKKLTQLLLLLSAAAILSCTSKGKIPERKLAKILAEFHLTDAVNKQQSESGSARYRDSTAYYLPILQKYGYTAEQLHSSMMQYGYHKEKARGLYKKVEKILEKQEAQYKKNRDKEYARQNIWEIQNAYSLPQDGDTSRLFFSVPLRGLGDYHLSANFTLYSNDSAQNPHLTVYFYAEQNDSSWQQKTVGQNRNGEANFYNLKLDNDSRLATHVQGYLFDYDIVDTVAATIRHAKVQNIMLRYIPKPILACD
jgi:hypothetical protein